MRRDDGIEMVPSERIINARLRGVRRMCSRGDVIGIVGITDELFRQ